MNQIPGITKIARRIHRGLGKSSRAKNYRERFGHDDKLLAGIEVARLSGLELGPLDKPLVKRPENRIKYLDHCSTAELRARFAKDANVNPANLAEVDFVMKSGKIRDVVNEQFDYVLASHVFEHVPNPIGWLKEIASLLNPGGILSLAVPDRRFTFDVLRPPTTPGEALEAYFTHRTKPSFANVFDQNFYWRSIEVASVVTGLQDPRKLSSPNSVAKALEYAESSLKPDTYCDVHCNLFSGEEFLEFIQLLQRLELTTFSVSKFFPCEKYNNEFVVHLRRD